MSAPAEKATKLVGICVRGLGKVKMLLSGGESHDDLLVKLWRSMQTTSQKVAYKWVNEWIYKGERRNFTKPNTQLRAAEVTRRYAAAGRRPVKQAFTEKSRYEIPPERSPSCQPPEDFVLLACCKSQTYICFNKEERVRKRLRHLRETALTLVVRAAVGAKRRVEITKSAVQANGRLSSNGRRTRCWPRGSGASAGEWRSWRAWRKRKTENAKRQTERKHNGKQGKNNNNTNMTGMVFRRLQN